LLALGGWQRFSLEDKDNAKHAAELVSMMGVKDMSPTDLQKFLSGKNSDVMPYINDHEEGYREAAVQKILRSFFNSSIYILHTPEGPGLV
jgi:zinc protease